MTWPNEYDLIDIARRSSRLVELLEQLNEPGATRRDDATEKCERALVLSIKVRRDVNSLCDLVRRTCE